MGTAKTKAQNKYIAKAYDRVNLTLKKDSDINKDAVQAAADKAGESLNGYITTAVAQRMERDTQGG